MLDHNEIVGWNQLREIIKIQSIRLLTIDHNPCAKVFGTRDFLIASMPSLCVLDNKVILDFERKLLVDLNLNLRKLHLTRFKP
jgi:hypothetical protein